jgi:hypothetical protein
LPQRIVDTCLETSFRGQGCNLTQIKQASGTFTLTSTTSGIRET